MTPPKILLERLDAIGRSLSGNGHALALLGLGSAGLETDRLDVYSDLDFFVITADGHKDGFLADLDWLSAVHPVAYAFRNTTDGYKLLFEDGIFCEFAVFEISELSGIPYPPARIVWKRAGVSPAIAAAEVHSPAKTDRKERLLGEALTNLYVGLGRERRGERLSALRFIQGYAVDRLVELVAMDREAITGARDPYAPERRFETRYPAEAERLADWCQGYARNAESARAILDYLAAHFELNETMLAATQELITIG